MTTTYEQRENRYHTAPADIQWLYASDDAGEFLRHVFDAYHLREELYYEYALAFGDVVLGFEEEGRLPQLLIERVGLPEKLATIVAHDLLEFINAHKATALTVAPSPQPTASNTPPETPVAPSWSHTHDAQPSAEVAPVPRFIPNAPSVPVATYRKPLTEMPRYGEKDPYRELP